MTVAALCHEAESGTTGRRLVQLLNLGGADHQFISVPRSFREIVGVFWALVTRPPKAVWVTQSSRTMGVALAAKLIHPRLRVVLDIGDLNVRLFRSTFGRVPVRVYLASTLEWICVRASYAIVTRSERLREHLPSRLQRRAQVIPDCWHPPLTQHHWQDHRFVVGMLGTVAWSEPMQWGYGFDLIEVLALLPADYTGVVVGDGPSLEMLKERAAAKLGAQRVRFVGRVNAEGLDAGLAECGVVLLTAPDVAAYAVRTTGKLPEFIARQHPIVATRVGAAGQLLAPELLVDAWPQMAWDEVYAEIAERIVQLTTEDVWAPYDESLVAYFAYETYRLTVQALLA
jgi:hypothetical protein